MFNILKIENAAYRGRSICDLGLKPAQFLVTQPLEFTALVNHNSRSGNR